MSSLRYFNAAGADPQGAIGEDHDPETHLIPLVLQSACGRRGAITVFGDDYPTADGTCIRDYVHVCDLADAHLGALRRLLDGVPGGHYNLGNDAGPAIRPGSSARPIWPGACSGGNRPIRTWNPSSRPPGAGTYRIRKGTGNDGLALSPMMRCPIDD